jgi:hypothetical protein
MEGAGEMKRISMALAVVAVVAAVAVLVYAMSLLWKGRRVSSLPGPAAEGIASSGPARSQGASTQPASRNAAPVELTDEVFNQMAKDIAETIQPIRWHRPEFDGKTELTPEELAKVKAVTARHFSNYQRIGSIRLRAKQTITPLVDNAETRRYVKNRFGIDSFDLEIIATHNPQYFAMRGRWGDDNNVREIVTPAGKFSSGHVGMGESWITAYLDGEIFPELSLLQCGHLREGVAWTLPAPSQEFESYLNKQPQARYSVVQTFNRDDGWVQSHWFNEQTGLLERTAMHELDKNGNPTKLWSFSVIEYAPYNGVQYVKRSLVYGQKMQVRLEFSTEDVNITPLDPIRPGLPTEGK